MQNRKWLSMLIALMISIGLWVYVVTVENPVKEIELHNIPVTLSGQDLLREDYDLLVTDSNIASGVTLTFSGKLSDMKKLQENKSEIQVTINVTHLRNAQTYNIPYDTADLTLPSSVSNQDVTLSSKSPNTVSVTLEKLDRKTVPVKVLVNVKTEENYTVDKLTQNYSEIIVEGPEEVVERISYAQAILERENVDQTISSVLPYTWIDENGNIVENEMLTCDVSEIEVSLPVLMYKDVPLEVSINKGGGATEDDCAISINPPSVRLSGDPSVLETINSIKIGTVQLSSLMTNDETLEYSIVVPTGCTSISGEEKAEVSVQIKNKAITTIRVPSSNFQYTGLPAGMRADFKTIVLLVTIRANEGDIEKIEADNLRVVADFSSVGTLDTSMNVPVTIYVDGFEGAGPISKESYSVYVDVVPTDEAGDAQ